MFALALLVMQAGALALGAKVEGTLPVRLEGGHNASEQAFEIVLGEHESATLTLESLDFDALLVVRDETTGAESRERGTWRYCNVWFRCEREGPAKLSVRVAAEDDRGGEFVLSAIAGKVDPPRGLENVREAASYCESVAERANARNDAPREARFLGIASQAAYRMQDFARARGFAERELEVARRGDLSDETLRAQVNLGGAQRILGELGSARTLLQEALRGFARARPLAQDPRAAERLAALELVATDHLGELEREEHGVACSVPWFRKALELALKANRPEFLPTGWCKLGDALGEIGDVTEGRAAIERGVALAEASNRPDVLADALWTRARLLERYGEPAEAKATAERALALSPAPASELGLRATLADALKDLGRYEEAQSAFDAVEARAHELGQDRYEIPLRLSRARIAYDLCDLPRARTLLDEALSMQEASGSPLHRAEILMMRGFVFFDQARVDDALTEYAKALDTCDATGERDFEATVLVDLGIVYEKSGDLHTAEAIYTQAEGRAHEAGAMSIADIARSGRAFVLFLRGRNAEAAELARGVAARREAAGDWRVAEAAHDTLARIGLADGDTRAVEDALCAAEQILDEQSTPSMDRFAAAGLRSRFADWGAICQDLVALRLGGVDHADPRHETLVRDGWENAGRWKGRSLLEHMRKGGAGSALLPRTSAGTTTVEFVDGLERLYAYVSTPNRLEWIDLGERQPIEERAQAYVRATVGRATPPHELAEQGMWLYRRLLSPLLGELRGDVRTLQIVPSAALAVLPFEALVDPRTVATSTSGFEDLHYLIDDADVVYAPSAPVLAELERRGRRRADPRYLVLGDPVYLGEDTSSKVATARPGSASFDFSRLKSTREESLEIARLLLLQDRTATDDQSTKLLRAGSERSAELSTARFDLYLGANASRSVLERDLGAYTSLHIAAHGLVDPDDPRRSGLLLAYEPQAHGLFTLEDVLGVHLDADMAVLSACETASGPIVRGEGVQSLACAFLEAGTRSVVASLWNVDDGNTSRMMRSFYAAHLEGRVHPARALRQAKLEFRHSAEVRGVNENVQGSARILTASNPCFWAPFVYVGAGPD